MLKWFESKTIVIGLIYVLSFFFKVFEAFLALSRIKWFKLGLFGSKLGTQHYDVNIVVLKRLES